MKNKYPKLEDSDDEFQVIGDIEEEEQKKDDKKKVVE